MSKSIISFALIVLVFSIAETFGADRQSLFNGANLALLLYIANKVNN